MNTKQHAPTEPTPGNLPEEQNNISAPLRRTVAIYDYCDESGKLRYQVVRYDPKDFRQRRPDGHGGWVWSISSLDPLPYHLPAALKAIQAGEILFLVEGEKDVLNLAALGLVATCNNGGAGKWGAAQSKYLAGAHVVLLPDNDEAGQDHVAKAAHYLREAGALSIKCIELPGLPDKGDVSDWLAAGGSREALLALVAAAPDYEPPAVEPPKIQPPSPARQEYITTDEPRYLAWAQAALEGVVAEVGSAKEGQRFAALKRGANRLGTIAARDWLTENECINALEVAAYQSGYTQKHGQGQTSKRILHYFKSGLPFPCELPPALSEKQPAPLPIPAPELLEELRDLSEPAERAILSVSGKRGPALVKLCKAAFQYYKRGESLKLKELARRSSLPYSTLCKAMNEYGGSALFCLNLSMSLSPSDDGRPSVEYIRPSLAELDQRLLDKLIRPALEQKHYRPLQAIVQDLNADLLSAAGMEVKDEYIEQANDKVQEGLLDQPDLRAAIATVRRKVDKELRRWSKELQVHKVFNVVTEEGKDWKTDLYGVAATRNALNVVGERQSYTAAEWKTGLKAKTLSRAERRLFIKREANYHPVGNLCSTLEELPAPNERDAFYGGYAALYTVYDKHTGALDTYPYRTPNAYENARAAIRAGHPVRIDYRQVSTVLDMSKAERQAEIERRQRQAEESKQRAEARQTAQATRETTEAGSDSPPPTPILPKRQDAEQPFGYTMAYALDTLTGIERLLKLPTLPASPIERFYRIVGSDPLLDCLVNECGGLVVEGQ